MTKFSRHFWSTLAVFTLRNTLDGTTSLAVCTLANRPTLHTFLVTSLISRSYLAQVDLAVDANTGSNWLDAK